MSGDKHIETRGRIDATKRKRPVLPRQNRKQNREGGREGGREGPYLVPGGVDDADLVLGGACGRPLVEGGQILLRERHGVSILEEREGGREGGREGVSEKR